jgi:hypothetical protein
VPGGDPVADDSNGLTVHDLEFDVVNRACNQSDGSMHVGGMHTRSKTDSPSNTSTLTRGSEEILGDLRRAPADRAKMR